MAAKAAGPFKPGENNVFVGNSTFRTLNSLRN